MNPDFEVLAPAGSFDILKAVIDAGADAVYLGGDRFGARAYAGNFSKDELLAALDYAHIRGKKIYLTVNTLFKNAELSELYDYLLPFYERGLDAVIVQDLGALISIRKWFPELPIHTSTQMTVTGVDGVRFLQKYGVSRVVMARETSIAEMKKIHEETGIELEAFVHGALCYSYSGQCLFSSMLGGRSGNRGRCAQPCRLPYTILDEKKKTVKEESYILSLKDLCGIENLPKLKEAGVFSLKIEGRMKQASYAAGVVSMYRKYVDLLAQSDDCTVSREDMDTIYALGNRCGFTDTYFTQKNSNDMVTRKKPSFQQQDTNIIYEKTYLPIDGVLKLHIGEPTELTVSCPDAGITVTVAQSAPEPAQKQPMTEDDLKKRLSKTKDTAFTFRNLDVEMDDMLFLPNGAINQLKRDGIAALEEEILKTCRRTISDAKTNGQEDESWKMSNERTKIGNVISVEDRKFLSCALEHSWVDALYLDVQAYERSTFFEELTKDVALCHRSGKRAFLIFPALFRERTSGFYSKHLNELLAVGLDGAVVKNYEEFFFVKTHLPELLIVADHNLYTYNDTAAALLYREGALADTIPLELNRREIAGRENTHSQMMVYGYYPLMFSAQCVNFNASGCDRHPKLLYLKDRYKKLFPVRNCCADCYNIIYNSVPTMLFAQLDELNNFGVHSFRLHFSVESEKEMRKVCGWFGDFLNGKGIAIPPEERESYTGGHYKRGVE